MKTRTCESCIFYDETPEPADINTLIASLLELSRLKDEG